MVIFHSYVSLPEGTIAHRDHWQSLNTEGFFFWSVETYLSDEEDKY